MGLSFINGMENLVVNVVALVTINVSLGVKKVEISAIMKQCVNSFCNLFS